MSAATSGPAADGTVEHYRMPDAGEGLTEAEIVTWRVQVGDTVEVNDVVVEVETAKSLVELPSPFAGTVTGLLAEEGETVAVGTPILAVRTGADDGADGGADDGADAGGSGAEDPRGADAHPDAAPAVGDAAPAAAGGSPVGPTAESAAHPSTQAAAGAGRTAVLVGYGPAAGATRRRPRRAPAAPGAAATGRASTPDQPRAKVLCAPPVRKLARDLGVDLAQVPADGDGIVRRAAVERFAAEAAGGAGGSVGSEGAVDRRPAPLDAPSGVERRIPVKGVRRATAEAMVASAFTAPHVSTWVQLDVTATMELLARLKADTAYAGLRLSPFTLLCRAVVEAARRFPEVNASWDEPAGEIVVHPHVNLGFAAATERGLVVPVVPAAERLDLAALAAAVAELVDVARAGRIQPAQMSGGTLTVTNVGVFGMDAGTPILPPGTGMIVACGQVRRLPWVVGTRGSTTDPERLEPRDVMTLSASFDHRFVDGELGSRYLADVASLLHDPATALARA